VPFIKRISLVLFSILCVVSQLISKEIESIYPGFEDWWHSPNLIDYDGFRRKLSHDCGVQIVGYYGNDLLGNPVGGINKAFRYAQLVIFGVNISPAPTLGIPDYNFQVTGFDAQGKNLQNDIGNAVPPATQFSGVVPIGLYELYIQYNSPQNDWQLSLGRLSAATHFAVTPFAEHYVSLAFDGNPWSLGVSNTNFRGPPFSNWSLLIDYKLNPQWHISGGFIGSSSQSINDENNKGVDFSWNPAKGTTFILELIYSWSFKDEENKLSGQLCVGGYYDTESFPMVSQKGTQQGLAAVWIIAQQHILNTNGAGNDGLSIWGSFAWTDPSSIAEVPYLISAGLAWQAPLPSRPNDALVLGAALGFFSKNLPNRDYEYDLELTYTLQLNPWFQLQPTIQGILQPSGNASITDALVLGAGITILL